LIVRLLFGVVRSEHWMKIYHPDDWLMPSDESPLNNMDKAKTVCENTGGINQPVLIVSDCIVA
jgi:hypothetical protein